MTQRYLLAVLLLAMTPFAGAADIEAGKTKSQMCQACHGADGNGTGAPDGGQYPRLAGQHADYLEKALRDYRSGKRPNAIMAGFATTLSDEDIENLGAFFASQHGPLHDLSTEK